MKGGVAQALALSFLLLALFLPREVPARSSGPPVSLFPGHSAPRKGVSSTPLSAPSAGWSGDVSPKGKALPESFWQGTPRALADTLLAHLPVTRSPSLQGLERRLLLSPAKAPRGPDAAGLDLPGLRARLLLSLGEVSAARAVITAAAQRKRGPLWRLSVDAAAAAGDLDQACGTVHKRIRAVRGLFWQRALIACQALEGKISEAGLGLQILAEEQAVKGDGLTLAVDNLAHHSAGKVLKELFRPDPLLLRLIVASGLGLSPSLVSGLSPALAFSLAQDEKAAPETRILAALRAARFGAFGAKPLRALFSAAPGALPPGPKFSPARRFAAIAKAANPAERLARISEFARRFGRDGSFVLAARLLAPSLRAIEPDPSLAASALDAARLSLAAGERRRAERWTALVPASEGRRLALLLHLAQKPGEAGENREQDSAEVAQSVLSLALFAGLGKAVSTEAWLRLPPPSWTAAGRLEAPAVSWLDLAEAARAKRIGETVLEAIIVAGSGGRLSTDPFVLYTAVSSLRRVGLIGAARRLALEAALGSGL